MRNVIRPNKINLIKSIIYPVLMMKQVKNIYSSLFIMSDVHENSEPLMPPPTPTTQVPTTHTPVPTTHTPVPTTPTPVPTTPLDLVEIFSYLLISKRELQKFTTLNVDQKGIDFISMLLYKSPETLNSISEKISEVLQDGVLNTDDVPILINLVKDIMNMDRNKISISMLSIDNVIVFIKTIFEILIIKDHIKVENKDKIFQLMDISFLLLTTSLDTKVNLVDCIKRLFKCA
jgi:hypothetical protein